MVLYTYKKVCIDKSMKRKKNFSIFNFNKQQTIGNQSAVSINLNTFNNMYNQQNYCGLKFLNYFFFFKNQPFFYKAFNVFCGVKSTVYYLFFNRSMFMKVFTTVTTNNLAESHLDKVIPGFLKKNYFYHVKTTTKIVVFNLFKFFSNFLLFLYFRLCSNFFLLNFYILTSVKKN